ncbi:MAG: hypothetical protein WCA92_12025 [Terriglobales bacterium]
MSSAAVQLAKAPTPSRARGFDLRGAFIVAAALFAASSAWHWSHVQRDIRTSETIVAEYLLVAGISVLVLSLLNRFGAAFPTIRVRSWILDGPAVVALAASIWLLGMRQFGGYDHSVMIEAGWLQLSSLVPFRDYPCTLPPLFLLGDRYAFLLFGVRWSSFVIFMACFAVLSFLFLNAQFRILGFPSPLAAALSIACELATTVVCSFWWHNPMTSLVGAMVFISALVCLAHPSKMRSWLLLLASLTCLTLSKPNAWPIGLCVVFLLVSRNATQRWRALATLLLAAASAAMICSLHGLNPVAVLQTYARIAETRGNPFRMVGLTDLNSVEWTIWSDSIAIAVLLFFCVLVRARKEWREHWREYACCVVTAITSVAMASMNYELKTSDLTPFLVALAVMAFRPWSRRRYDGLGYGVVVTLLVFLATLSVYWGITRLRVRGIGEGRFFENVQTQEIPGGFFAGLHTGPRFPKVLGQIDKALEKYPSANVFFGPRMEFSYAAFDRRPPKGLPIWWHPGSSFALSNLPAISHSLETDDFDLMIFLKNDCTRMPIFALRHKLQSYDHDVEFSELDVFVRRKGPEMAAALP